MGDNPIRVYADTSVFGGVFEAEYSGASRAFFNQVSNKLITLVVSVTVQDELAGAPKHVRDFFEEMAAFAESATITPKTESLQKAYLSNGIVGERHFTDALHVALAVTSRCDAIVSWNFKHIVQMDRIRKYNAVNLLSGYNTLAIHTPREVLRDEA